MRSNVPSVDRLSTTMISSASAAHFAIEATCRPISGAQL
jgi:hypothetical protein